METKKQVRELTGIVTSDAMQKTRIVEVARLIHHPKYHKQMKVTTRYAAHDEKNATHVGDRVVIAESRPLSKTKRWSIARTITTQPSA